MFFDFLEMVCNIVKSLFWWFIGLLYFGFYFYVFVVVGFIGIIVLLFFVGVVVIVVGGYLFYVCWVFVKNKLVCNVGNENKWFCK